MKRRSGLMLKILVSIFLGPQFLFIFEVPAYGQPKPLVVLAESELNDQSLYDGWIEFKDKDVRSEAQRREILQDLEENFNRRALARRKIKRTRPGLFDETDFPLAAKYLAGVAATGAEVRVKSRWLNGVSVLANKEQILKIKDLPYVKGVVDLHEHKPRTMLKEKPAETLLKARGTGGVYGSAERQVSLLGLDKLHKAGFTGKGIRVAVIDCGFNLSHKAFNDPKHSLMAAAAWDFVENDGDIVPRANIHTENYDHGTNVLGTIASYAPGELMGTAYGAEFILCNAEDGPEEYYLEERWFVAALEFAESHGADIVTSSLVLYEGYSQEDTDGKTSVMTRGMNIATGNGVLCFHGSGNFGHDQDPATSHLAPPSDGVDVISVGALNYQGKIAGFSSDGPTKDGRLKPEVLSMGTPVSTVAVVDKEFYGRMGGTSAATPLMAGAAACILQVHPEWTVAQMRKALFESGDFFRREGKPDPLFVRGYGIPDVYLAAGLGVATKDAPLDYGEFAGVYKFEFEGEKLTMQFTVKNKKLWAQMVPDIYEVGELTADTRKPTLFRATTFHGELWVFEFIKDEKGAFTKCKFKEIGFEGEIVGDKIQDNKEIEKTKLYGEIAGDYELDIGRIIPFKVLFKGEKLYFDALVEGLEPEEMRQAVGKEMVFESIDPNGDEVTFSFYRDSRGRISGCTVTILISGMQAEAAKIIKAGIQVDTAKLYAELSGSYEFDVGDRIVPFWLIVKNGKLFLDIKVEGVDPEEMIPVVGEVMKFESIANGYKVIATFKRNDEGKIKGCTIYYPEMGTEYEAVKKDKSR